MTQDIRPHVVIIGGGFAGIRAARKLRQEDVRVTVVDRRNHHLFQPLLYQVASAALNPADIAVPIRGLLRRHSADVLLGEVTSVDPENRRVILKDGELDYDYLILASGASHSYFGNDPWAKHAPGLKTMDDALSIRRRVLLAYEAAEREPDPVRREELLTFVIVGGGATGVEMAGALSEIAHHSLADDFNRIDPRTARVILVEGRDKVLGEYPADLSDEAARSLGEHGVEVRCGVKVTDVDGTGVQLNGSEWIRAHTVIWAAGVAASPLSKSLGAPLDGIGRVKVTPELTVPGRPEIFVVGDLAHVEQDGKILSQVAPAAMQMGNAAGDNLRRQLHGRPMKPFRYWDRGTFAVIGRGAAVGVAFNAVRMQGVLAWLSWLFIHVLFLVGFRNKAVVLFQWAYSYLTLRRSGRIITGPTPDLRLTSPQLVKRRRDKAA